MSKASKASEVKFKAMAMMVAMKEAKKVAMKEVMVKVEAFRAKINQALFVNVGISADSRVHSYNAKSFALSFLVDS